MASIYPRGKTLWIKHIDSNGCLIRKSLHLRDDKQGRREAEKYKKAIEIGASELVNIFHSSTEKRLTFIEASDILFAEKEIDKNKYSLYKIAFDWFVKLNGNIYVDDFSDKHYQKFRDYLLKRKSYHTVCTYLNHIRILFNMLIEKKFYNKPNPVKKLKEKPKKITIISDSDFNAILSHLQQNNEQAYKLIKLLKLSGLRLSEAIFLEWQDIDFTENVITVNNKKANRIDFIPLHNELKEFLSEFRQEEGRLFTYKSRFSTTFWSRALTKLNLPKYKIHDIRRTFGSKYASQLTPIELMKVMRHRDIKTTLKHYIKLDLQQITSKMNTC